MEDKLNLIKENMDLFEANQSIYEAIKYLLNSNEKLKSEVESTVRCINDYYNNEEDDIPVSDILDSIYSDGSELLNELK